MFRTTKTPSLFIPIIIPIFSVQNPDNGLGIIQTPSTTPLCSKVCRSSMSLCSATLIQQAQHRRPDQSLSFSPSLLSSIEQKCSTLNEPPTNHEPPKLQQASPPPDLPHRGLRICFHRLPNLPRNATSFQIRFGQNGIQECIVHKGRCQSRG